MDQFFKCFILQNHHCLHQIRCLLSFIICLVHLNLQIVGYSNRVVRMFLHIFKLEFLSLIYIGFQWGKIDNDTVQAMRILK